jgi:hypothetical protein
MDRYIEQLIEDLEEAAKNPPAPFHFETPPHMEERPDLAELALVPFKSIEEWTGIKQEVFPEIGQLAYGQWERLNDAIVKVLDSINVQLIGAPPDLPPEILYDVLTTNWDYEVQFLPLSGMDLELCAGDPETCPFGQFCGCNDEFDEHEIPHRFLEFIPKIAETIDAGFICYLNPDTMEMEDVLKAQMDAPEEFEMNTGEPLGLEGLNFHKWENCMVFKPLESYESFSIMEEFMFSLDDDLFSEKLMYALNHKKPFGHFKNLIDNSRYREDWFSFKKTWLENHVKEHIFNEINDCSAFDFDSVNGLFNDDGTKIDPETVPLPGLCVICKLHQTEDWEENILCLLNRNDQRNESDFECGMFEKI